MQITVIYLSGTGFEQTFFLFCIVFKYILSNCFEYFPKLFWLCHGVLTLINKGTINQLGFVLIWIEVAVLLSFSFAVIMVDLCPPPPFFLKI